MMEWREGGVQRTIHDSQPTHIRNYIDQIKSFMLWIKYSAKREGLLKTIIQKGSQIGANRSSLLNICIT